MSVMRFALVGACLGLLLSADARTWRVEPGTTLDEVNGWDVRPGDKVLFRRGGVWRGTLKPRSGRPGAPVVYSFFGEGAKPQLSCSVRVADRDGWLSANHDGRWELWQTRPTCAGDLAPEVRGVFGTAMGLVQEGASEDNIARVVAGEADLNRHLTFWYDAERRRVVLRSWCNPFDYLGAAELVVARPIIDQTGCHDVVYEGLSLRYGGAAAVGGADVARVTVRNCDISYVVSGIVFGGDATACRAERNRIWQARDAALAVKGASDIALTDNVVWKCGVSFACGKNARNVRFAYNTCVEAGLGWGREKAASACGSHLVLAGAASVASNIFYRCTAEAIRLSGAAESRLDGNLYWLPSDWDGVANRVCLWTGKAREARLFEAGEEAFRKFQQETGLETRGVFRRPDFTNAYRKDYRLFNAGADYGARGLPGVDEDQAVTNGAPYGVESLRSGLWTVSVDGRDAFVCRAFARYNSPDYPRDEYAFVNLDAKDGLELVIEARDGRDLSNVLIQPKSAPVRLTRQGRSRLAVTVLRPCKFTVEPNERRVGPLFVFANPPERNIPAANDLKVRYFGAGIHRVPGDVVRLGTGETLYLAEGAVLQAAVRAEGSDIRLCGRGVLDASVFESTRGNKGPQYAFVDLYKCRNVTLEDLTLLGSYHWTVYPEGCDGVTLRNVKICGSWCANDDGIDPSNTRDLLIDDCFFRTQDDCVAVKGITRANGNCERLAVRNSIFWCDFARIVCLGHESRAAHIADFTFENNDVIRYVRPLMLVEPGDDMAISNVVFRNVRVRTDAHGRTEATMRIQPVVNVYTQSDKPGRIANVTVADVAFEGTAIPLRFFVKGGDRTRMTRNVRFSGVTVNGIPATEQTPARPSGCTVSNVWFDGEARPDGDEPLFVRGPYTEDVVFDVGATESRTLRVFPKDDAWWWARRDEKAREIAALPKGDVDLVLLGDSITQGWDGQPALERLRKSRTVLTLGYNGDTVGNLVWRCLWGELDGYRARDILVLIGTNDLGGGNAAPEDVFAAVRKLVALIRIKQPRARLHLLAVLPRDVGGKETPRLWPDRITAYNRLLQGLADGQHVFFHDIGARFLDAAGRLNAALFWDRLHPNPSGYDIWADEIERMLQNRGL